MSEDVSELPPLDLAPVVTTIVEIMMEPFRALLIELRDDGRLTDEELRELRADVRDQTARLPFLLRHRLPALWESPQKPRGGLLEHRSRAEPESI